MSLRGNTDCFSSSNIVITFCVNLSDSSMNRKLFLLMIAPMAAFAMSSTSYAMGDPVRAELGTVKWERDYKAAKSKSAQTGKPLMMFFQEVPG